VRNQAAQDCCDGGRRASPCTVPCASPPLRHPCGARRGMAKTADVRKLPGWEGVDAKICPTGKDLMCMIYQLQDDTTVCAPRGSPGRGRQSGGRSGVQGPRGGAARRGKARLNAPAPSQTHSRPQVWAVNSGFGVAQVGPEGGEGAGPPRTLTLPASPPAAFPPSRPFKLLLPFYFTRQECGVAYTPYQKSAASRASLMDPEQAGAACYAEAVKLKERLPLCAQQVGNPRRGREAVQQACAWRIRCLKRRPARPPRPLLTPSTSPPPSHRCWRWPTPPPPPCTATTCATPRASPRRRWDPAR
jgi:hypothetical protein